MDEKFLGQFARQANQPVVIATKFMPFPWRWRKSSVIDALRRSLKRLGIDRVDLYKSISLSRPYPSRRGWRAWRMRWTQD
jgi:aryl-alcohol dehydrogenase-like predicted oxidoreductase